MYLNSITEAIGNTPLVKLNKVMGATEGTVLTKVEYFNPGNSIKDRIAVKMIEDAEAKGLLNPEALSLRGLPEIPEWDLHWWLLQKAISAFLPPPISKAKAK